MKADERTDQSITAKEALVLFGVPRWQTGSGGGSAGASHGESLVAMVSGLAASG